MNNKEWSLNGLTKSQLDEIFDIDFITGIVTKKLRPREHFPTERSYITHKFCSAGMVASHNSCGYVGLSAKVDGKVYKLQAHRLVYSMFHNERAPDVIDHADQNRSNNSISNLRPSNKSHNAQNTKLISRNRSGIMGVWYDKARNAYQVYIDSQGERLRLGRRKSFLDACCLRKSAEVKLGFSPIHGRT